MKKLLYIIFLMTLAGNLKAQENNFTFQFSRILFKDLVDTIEKRVEVKIYYSNKWVDSLYLNINSENDSIENFLSRALTKEGFSFIKDENLGGEIDMRGKAQIIMGKGRNTGTMDFIVNCHKEINKMWDDAEFAEVQEMKPNTNFYENDKF